jgi:hypothetical protein
MVPNNPVFASLESHCPLLCFHVHTDCSMSSFSLFSRGLLVGFNHQQLDKRTRQLSSAYFDWGTFCCFWRPGMVLFELELSLCKSSPFFKISLKYKLKRQICKGNVDLLPTGKDNKQHSWTEQGHSQVRVGLQCLTRPMGNSCIYESSIL